MMVTSKYVQSHNRINENQANDRQNDFQGDSEGGNEFLNFLFQGRHFPQEYPNFDDSEGEEVSAELMLLGVDPNKGADN